MQKQSEHTIGAQVKTSLYVSSIRSDTASAAASAPAPIFVFIHGWGMHSGIWAQLVEILKPHFNCLLVDLPGMGRSPLKGGDYTLATVVEQVVEALEPWKDVPLHWLGWSLGAIVAAHVAPRFVHSQTMSLAAMGLQFVADENHDVGMGQDEFKLFQALLDEDYEGTLYRFLGLNTKGSVHQRAEIRLLQQLVFTYGIPAQKALRGGLEILEQESLQVILQKPPLATQMIFGEHDALVSVEQRVKVESACADIACVTIPHAGHIPFLSQTQAFADVLIQFVNKEAS